MADGKSVEQEVVGNFSGAQLEAIAGVVQQLLDKALSERGSRKSSGLASDERGAAGKNGDTTPETEKYPYVQYLEFEQRVGSAPAPTCLQKVTTPLILREWIKELKDLPDAEFRNYIHY